MTEYKIKTKEGHIENTSVIIHNTVNQLHSMLSCIFVLDEELEPLISKNIRSIPNPEDIIAAFHTAYSEGQSAPVILFNEWNFIQIKRDTLIFLAVIHYTDSLTDIMSITVYLDGFYQLLKTYLRQDALDRNIILDNVLLVMELIDESIDFGIVQVTEPTIIKDYIRVKVNLPDSEFSSGNNDGNKYDRDFGSASNTGNNNLFVYKSHRDSEDDESEDSEKELEERLHRKKQQAELHKYIKKQQKLAKNMLKTITSPDVSKILELRKHVNLLNKDDLKLVDAETDENYINSHIARTTIMAISWRTKGIYYAKNEFFLDVLERQEYVMDFKEGIIRKNLIQGKIACRCYLSGMPKLKIAINKLVQKDPQFMSQSRFHQCVSFETLQNKEIEFIPPDGEFTLCEYELKRHVKDPPSIKLTAFEIKPKLKKFKIQITLKVATYFKAQNSTASLDLKIPLSKLFKDYEIDLTKPPRFKSDVGQVLFNLSDDFLLWEIGTMKGGHGENEKSMTAEFSLFNEDEYHRLQEERKISMNPPPLREGPKLEELYEQLHDKKNNNEKDEDANENINDSDIKKQNKVTTDPGLLPQYLSCDFEIPYYACSGLKVDYLKIEEEQLQYQSFPWVRYKTTNDTEYVFIV